MYARKKTTVYSDTDLFIFIIMYVCMHDDSPKHVSPPA